MMAGEVLPCLSNPMLLDDADMGLMGLFCCMPPDDTHQSHRISPRVTKTIPCPPPRHSWRVGSLVCLDFVRGIRGGRALYKRVRGREGNVMALRLMQSKC